MTHADWGGINAEAFPIRRGDVWQVGPHVLCCGDIQAGDALKLLDKFGDPDITYTDPPWNRGLATTFRTQAAVPEKVDFDRLMLDLALVLKRTKREAVIEMGIQETGTICAAMQAQGATVENVWSATYGSKRLEMRMIHLVWQGPASPMATETLYGWNAAMAALRGIFRPGDRVFDPCLGQGGTLRMVYGLGGSVLGMELNPKRLSTAMVMAAEMAGIAPKLIDKL